MLSSIAESMSVSERVHPRWKDIWETETIPKFDKQSPSPALVKLLEEGKVPLGRALIPGCGRGYDVALLASPNRHALGIDIVDTAM